MSVEVMKSNTMRLPLILSAAMAVLPTHAAWAQPIGTNPPLGTGTPTGTGTPAGTGTPPGTGPVSTQPTGTTPTTPPATDTPSTPPPRYHDFLDTRLTWTFGDDDLVAPTGQRVPNSPLPRIGDRSQYQLFFDALNSRFAGRENLTHLVMYARAPGFIKNLITEASLVMRVDFTELTSGSGNLGRSFYDAGSYLRIQYQTNPGRPNDGLALTFFPFDTDRFRLGYLWDLSWGGNDIFPRRVGGAPGAKLEFNHGPFSIFAGFKTAAIVVPLPVMISSSDIDTVRVDETQYAGLGGVGIKFHDMVRFDAGFGYFQQGRFDVPGVRGLPVFLYGGSARLVINSNLAPSQSIDMMLYRNHPDFPMRLFAPETYTPGQVSWMVSFEGSVVNQQLASLEVANATAMQLGVAGAVQARMKIGYFSVGLTGLYRDVPFILRNVPSFIPFFAVPSDARVSPEGFFALSADYRIAPANLLPSLIVGLQLPATFSADVDEGSLKSQRTLVIRRAGNFSILPPGQSALPIVSARLALKWDLSSIFAVVGWSQLVYDSNSTLLDVDATGTRQVRVFQAPLQVGFGLSTQARF